MCVSAAPAHFGGTKILLNQTTLAGIGLIYVLAYQNSAQSLLGPNAMLIHIPSALPMGPANFVNTTGFPHILDDMVTAVMPSQRRSATKSAMSFAMVQVFESGPYHVVLADDPTLIPSALQEVPVEKRPAIGPELFRFFGRELNGWKTALCCFNNRDLQEPPPIMVWYSPTQRESGRFRLPAIDCHTGGAPDLQARVRRDHWLLIGGDNLPGGHPVNYRDDITPEVMGLLPRRVHGMRFDGLGQNGDFSFSHQLAMQGNLQPQILLPGQ